MLSVLFPGQGSQSVGMCKEFYDNFEYVKNLFKEADDILKINITKMILEGPKENLNLTENTQPAIFLTSYSIFKVLNQESNLDLSKAKFYAGHSLGEYSALCCAKSITFDQTINLLEHRGKAMQNALPDGDGGMIAILGTEIEIINKILVKNNKHICYVANDNTLGQVVVSGKKNSLNLLSEELKEKNIKSISLPVNAPFHCPLMKNATDEMRNIILDTIFYDPIVSVISNVTASPQNKSQEIKNLLIEQIENPVRWRESVHNMINLGVNKFIEVGPGKILSGLIKRIDRNIKLNQVNNLEDLKNI